MKHHKHKFITSFIVAFQGISFAACRERNMRIHLVASALALAASVFFRVEKLELLFVLTAIFLVLITEMINTALEKSVDLSTPEYNHLAQTAKNVAAGAVLFASFYALAVAWLVFADRLTALAKYFSIH